MRILVTNDDGIFSPGLSALADVAVRRVAVHDGDVRVVAPDVEQSSMSHAITASRPLTYHKTSVADHDAYRVNGTPADCVALGTHHWDEVDAVLSGVNLGMNLGNAIWHSGTLAAAKQAALLGIQGIAFSTSATRDEEIDFALLAPWIDRVLDLVLGDPALPLVNVNLPAQPRGIRWTRQSCRHYDGRVVRGEHPMGKTHYWFVVHPVEELEEGTDRWAFRNDFVSVTPLRLDLTSDEGLEHARRSHPAEEAAP